jgi:hypothetical protein
MSHLLALLIIAGWYFALTTELGKKVLFVCSEILGIIIFLSVMLLSVLWSALILVGAIHG